jgi:hypothetical protein
MACELLQGLETQDLQRIEKSLNPLRKTLAARHCLTGRAYDTGSLLMLEQLDLLEGITESVEAAVEAIRRSSRPRFLRMQTAESLLRHLVGDKNAARQVDVPVC